MHKSQITLKYHEKRYISLTNPIMPFTIFNLFNINYTEG